VRACGGTRPSSSASTRSHRKRGRARVSGAHRAGLRQSNCCARHFNGIGWRALHVQPRLAPRVPRSPGRDPRSSCRGRQSDRAKKAWRIDSRLNGRPEASKAMGAKDILCHGSVKREAKTENGQGRISCRPPQLLYSMMAHRERIGTWCGRGDSNPHALASVSPSSWCVCQFRHFRKRQRAVSNSQPSVKARLLATREQTTTGHRQRTNATSEAPGAKLARVPWEQALWMLAWLA
jgi:hypothetical protein